MGDGVPRDLMSTAKFEGRVSSVTDSVSVESPRVVSSFDVLRLSALDDDYEQHANELS